MPSSKKKVRKAKSPKNKIIMNERINPNINQKEQRKLEQSREDAEWLADYLTRHSETIVSPENLRESGPEIAEFEGMVASFESTHSLAELNLIIDLTFSDAPEHPIRELARLALIPIVAKLNALKRETNISNEKYEKLKAEYKRLSRAVGMINNNKVDHNR